VINGTNYGTSGTIEVDPGTPLNISFRHPTNGLSITAENVHAWDELGHELNNEDVSNGYSITVIANTEATDDSPTKWRYEPYVMEGNGNINPPNGIWIDSGASQNVTVSANFPQRIYRIQVNGNDTYIDEETYSFTLVMNEDKTVRVWFH